MIQTLNLSTIIPSTATGKLYFEHDPERYLQHLVYLFAYIGLDTPSFLTLGIAAATSQNLSYTQQTACKHRPPFYLEIENTDSLYNAEIEHVLFWFAKMNPLQPFERTLTQLSFSRLTNLKLYFESD